jgi:hypothetical protein
MSAEIPTVWPNDVAEEVISPLAFLRVQANALGRLTRGLVEGDVTTVSGDSSRILHRLDLYAPALEYRQRVLTAAHGEDALYPVEVRADTFRAPRPVTFSGSRAASKSEDESEKWGGKSASTYQELIEVVSEVLRSPQVRSAIQSMVARSSEKSELRFAQGLAQALTKPDSAGSDAKTE